MRRRRRRIYFRDGPPLNFDGHRKDRALVSGNKSHLYRYPATGLIQKERAPQGGLRRPLLILKRMERARHRLDAPINEHT